tara:strand:- start:131 stop:469 length:339 start_codon:yes stop_codon:yes gene_type:complete
MSPLPLVDVSEEQLTIAGTALGITAAKLADSATPAQPLNIVRATFHHQAGGDIYHSSVTADPSNSGATGELLQSAGSRWIVKGREAIVAWRAKKASGADDATIQVTLSTGNY